LADPCAGDLTGPCYAGTDGGYLVRTVDSYQPTCTVTAGKTTADFFFCYTPWNMSSTSATGIQFGGGDVGTSLNVTANYMANFITTAAFVREYRPVAACAKWVPTGAVGNRSGEVSLGYSPGLLFPAVGSLGTAFLSQIKASSLHQQGNGMENHEVVWVPTIVDEIWTSNVSGPQPGAGTITIGLNNVDASVSGTSATLNGYIQVTTVWEWTPTAAGSLSTPLKTPAPESSQQVISSFGAVKNLVLNKVMQMGGAAGNLAMKMGAMYIDRYTTASYNNGRFNAGNYLAY